MKRPTLMTAASMALICTALAGSSTANPRLLKEAKDMGLPAQSCQYCHVSKIPKKEGFKPDDLNARGKWLLDEKGKQKAQDTKADWLKNYPGGTEQK